MIADWKRASLGLLPPTMHWKQDQLGGKMATAVAVYVRAARQTSTPLSARVLGIAAAAVAAVIAAARIRVAASTARRLRSPPQQTLALMILAAACSGLHAKTIMKCARFFFIFKMSL